MSGSDLNGALACISDAQSKIAFIRNEIVDLITLADENIDEEDFRKIVQERTAYLLETLDNIA